MKKSLWAELRYISLKQMMKLQVMILTIVWRSYTENQMMSKKALNIT